MPLKCHVPSLQWLCLKNVARNLERVWDKDSMDNCLAEKFVPALISIRKDTQSLTSEVLDILLTSHLMTLDLAFCPGLFPRQVVSEALLQTIGMRCKKLTTLDLAHCNKVPAESLVNLVKCLPCLTQLDLSMTQCDSRVLCTLASSCRRLRELTIAKCMRLTKDSLLYLTYDPHSHSFRSLGLQSLTANGLKSRVYDKYQIRALAFVILALPKLTFVWHDFLTEALCLIHSQRFDDTQLLPEFPSLKEVASGRVATGPILALRRMEGVNDSNMPEAIALCPHLTRVSMILGNDPLWSQHVLSCRYLTYLALDCTIKKDLGELLPVTAILGAQLVTLLVYGFSFKDPVSLHTLLRHCVNLQKFKARLVSHVEDVHGSQPDNEEAMAWDFDLCPLVFPELSDFSLEYCDLENLLPFRHALVLEKCVVSVMKHAPLLQYLVLLYLPFSLEVIFQEVLKCPGTSLLRLFTLTFDLAQLSMPTVDLLLSSNNRLSSITLYTRQKAGIAKYKKILQKIKRSGIEVEILVSLA